MKKPDPERSCRISEEFEDLAGSMLNADNVERLKNVGNLLFDKDEIYATADQLSILFRKLCVENQITDAYFNEKYRQYAINVLGKLPQSAANNRANTVKMLKKGSRLSWKKFLELTTLVLGLRLTNLRIDVVNLKTNSVNSYDLDGSSIIDITDDSSITEN